MIYSPPMPKLRYDPWGNLLPARMHWKHGQYWHVISRRRPPWMPLGRDFGEALVAWAKIEGGKAAPHLVSEAWAVYAASARGLLRLAPSTQRHYRGAWTREGSGLLAVFGDMTLRSVRRSDVLAFLEAREAAGAAVAGNRDVAALAAVFRFARERDWTDNEPCRVSRNREQKRTRIATEAELTALSLAATPLWRALMALEVMIGPRESEIRLLHRRHLEAEHLVIERPKTGAVTEFPWDDWPGLRDIIDAALYAHPRPSVWVFPSRKGGPYSEDGFRTVWGRLCAKAGVTGLQFRDMRRTAAVKAESLELARGMLGHTTLSITKGVYRPRDRVKPGGGG